MVAAAQRVPLRPAAAVELGLHDELEGEPNRVVEPGLVQFFVKLHEELDRSLRDVVIERAATTLAVRCGGIRSQVSDIDAMVPAALLALSPRQSASGVAGQVQEVLVSGHAMGTQEQLTHAGRTRRLHPDLGRSRFLIDRLPIPLLQVQRVDAHVAAVGRDGPQQPRRTLERLPGSGLVSPVRRGRQQQTLQKYDQTDHAHCLVS